MKQITLENHLLSIFETLMQHYNAQGWWPLLQNREPYHCGDYSYPHNESEIFEIMLGAILTQNTTWKQAEKSLYRLAALEAIKPEKILAIDDISLKEAIKPVGYFNQKAVYLREISRFFLDLKGSTPSRKALLQVKGVGEETADCILLYAFKQPEFVVDAYTRRMFASLELIDPKAKYGEIKRFFESHLPVELILYQEYHALIVQHGKRYFSKKPYGTNDPIFSAVTTIFPN